VSTQYAKIREALGWRVQLAACVAKKPRKA